VQKIAHFYSKKRKKWVEKTKDFSTQTLGVKDGTCSATLHRKALPLRGRYHAGVAKGRWLPFVGDHYKLLFTFSSPIPTRSSPITILPVK